MGGSISKAIKEQQEQNDEESVRQLQTLEQLLDAKVEAAADKITADARKDKSLPIASVVDTRKQYTVSVKDVPDEAIAKTVQEIVGGDFTSGLVGMLSVALNEFLGNTAAGASEKKDFHVVFSNNAILRADYMFYKYEFSSKGLKDDYQNGFCYYSQTSVLDIKKVSPQIVLYEIARAIGNKDLAKAAEKLKEIADALPEELSGTVHKLEDLRGNGRLVQKPDVVLHSIAKTKKRRRSRKPRDYRTKQDMSPRYFITNN